MSKTKTSTVRFLAALSAFVLWNALAQTGCAAAPTAPRARPAAAASA